MASFRTCSKPQAATAPYPARVFFDNTTSQLSFGGDLLITDTNNPIDSIIGRGKFQVDPLIAIGPMDNGSIHLSDTEVQIVDNLTGDTLLNAFLLEVAYMPSTLPGFTGMIQGYIDIPPDFAGSIYDTIVSEFLQGMSAQRDKNGLPMLWFYANQPLFDSAGNSLISETGVTGNLKLAISIPEPSGILLFGTGMAITIFLSRMRKEAGQSHRHVMNPSTSARNSSDAEAISLLFFIPTLLVVLRRNRFITIWRTIARLLAAKPLRVRDWSSAS